MTTVSRPTTTGWWRFFLAAIAAVLVGLLGVTSASAATLTVAETRVGASTPTVAHIVGPHESVSTGQRWGHAPSQAQLTAGRGVAANTAEAAAGTAARVGPTTAHGAERIAGAGATRGGVLAEEDILLARDYGQALTQADGASVRVLQNEAGRFNVVVDGERGLITTFSNLSQKSLERLATRYGWE
jgi:hypothetical protein